MPSLSRGQRRLLQYATQDGELTSLKRKRSEDVAPVLKKRKEKRSQSKANGTTVSAEETQPNASAPLSRDVLEFLRERCPKAPRKLRQRQLRAIEELSAARVPQTSEESAAFALKRVEVKDQIDAFAVMALAALQRRALWSGGPTVHGAFLFLLVETDDDAAALTAHIKKTYKIQHTLLLDGSRFPTFPAVEKDDTEDGRTSVSALSERTALVIASFQSFLMVDARSAIWKFIGTYAIWLKSSSDMPSSLKSMTEEARSEMYEKLCRQRWRCLGHVPLAVVIAPSRNSLFAHVVDMLTTATPADDGGKNNNNNSGSTSNNTMNNGNKSKKGKENENEELVEENKSASTTTTMRSPVTVHYAVVEGSHRFQTLYALLMGLHAGQGLVVHFATKEACKFMYDILYALGELPASLLLLSDYEGPSTCASVQDKDEDRGKLCAQFDKIISEVSQEDSSFTKQAKDRVVLLSAFGVVPHRGTIFLQYDLIVDIVNFAQFTCDVLTPAAYNQAAVGSIVRHRSRSRTPTPTPPSSQRDRKGAAKGGNMSTKTATIGGLTTSLPAGAMYQMILVLLRQNELEAALKYLNSPAKRLSLTFEKLPQLPSATRFLLSVQKMRSLHKKQFAVQNAAYAAYRATMLLYSLIGPADVYNGQRVNLSKVAEEFGYTDIPIVDLRTRDTPFRPKEDIYRAAKERAAVEYRKMRAYANEHIIGEAPEEHIVDDVEDEGENK